MRNTTIDSIYITQRDTAQEKGQLQVITVDLFDNEIHTTTGFQTVAECWNYARAFAKVVGLENDSINADVFDEPAKGNV